MRAETAFEIVGRPDVDIAIAELKKIDIAHGARPSP
jgi:hypothetical protein